MEWRPESTIPAPEYLLKRSGGLNPHPLSQIGKATHISRPEPGRRFIHADRFQGVNCSIRRLIRPVIWQVACDLNRGADCRKPQSVESRVFGKAPSQTIGERLRLTSVAAQSERDRRAGQVYFTRSGSCRDRRHPSRRFAITERGARQGIQRSPSSDLSFHSPSLKHLKSAARQVQRLPPPAHCSGCQRLRVNPPVRV